MESSPVRGLGEARAQLAQTSCAGQRLPSVGGSRGHKRWGLRAPQLPTNVLSTWS